MLTITGTLYYRAPEMFSGGGYNEKVDIWSFGSVMFESLFGITPFTGKDKEDLRRNVNTGIVRLP